MVQMRRRPAASSTATPVARLSCYRATRPTRDATGARKEEASLQSLSSEPMVTRENVQTAPVFPSEHPSCPEFKVNSEGLP